MPVPTPNTTFSGFEATVTLNGATVSVSQYADLDTTRELEEVLAIGSFNPVDLKEVVDHAIQVTLKRAYFADATAADFFTVFGRNAQGYANAVTVTLKINDQSAGANSPGFKTFTVSSCKAHDYKIAVQAGKGIIIEDLQLKGLTITRA